MSVGLLVVDIHSFKLWFPARSSLFYLNLKFGELVLMYKCNVSKLERVLFSKFCKQRVCAQYIFLDASVHCRDGNGCPSSFHMTTGTDTCLERPSWETLRTKLKMFCVQKTRFSFILIALCQNFI
jgi:hypothetical protein